MEDINQKLMGRAKFASLVLQAVPFLRMVGLNGSLARGKATPSSDIDFLIIADTGRIWTCRAFTAFALFVTGMKRSSRKIAGQICLNRYITTNSLVIYPYDEYHANNYSHTIPLIDRGIYQEFLIQNSWMKNYSEQKILYSELINDSFWLGIYRKLAEYILSGMIGNILESQIKKYQIKRIKNHPLTKKNQGIIVASDLMLCFHPTSKTNLTKIG